MCNFVKRVPSTKRTLSLNEHRSILRKLMKGVNIEETLKSLYNHQMDEKLEECDHIVGVLIGLCNRSAIGRIAEYTLRQWVNRAGKKVEPIRYEYKRIVVEGKPKRRSSKKSRSLRLEFLHWQIESKICIEPELYEREKENEQFYNIRKEVIVVPPVPQNSEKTILKRKSEDEEDSCKIS